MSKAEINLLPPRVLMERVRRIYLQRAGRLYGVLVVGIVLLLLVYGGIGWMLWSLNGELEGKTTTFNQDTKVVQDQVRTVNTLLTALGRYTDQNVPWMSQVHEALLIVPEGVMVREVELKESPTPGGEKRKYIEISGESSSRSAVVEYEKALVDLWWVEKVESPLKNLASGTTVSFSFSLERSNTAKEKKSL